MTKQHPNRCDHECVCSKPENCRPKQGCAKEDCPHDTRSRPTPSPIHDNEFNEEGEEMTEQQDKHPMTPVYEGELTSLIYADAIDKRLEIVALIHSRDCSPYSSGSCEPAGQEPSGNFYIISSCQISKLAKLADSEHTCDDYNEWRQTIKDVCAHLLSEHDRAIEQAARDDEIRKRSVPAYEAMLAESLTEDQTRTLLMWLARNKKEMFSQIVCPNCREDVAEKAAAEARHAAIYEILTDLKFACPGGEPTPICDLCGANRYCIELRSKEQKP